MSSNEDIKRIRENIKKLASHITNLIVSKNVKYRGQARIINKKIIVKLLERLNVKNILERDKKIKSLVKDALDGIVNKVEEIEEIEKALEPNIGDEDIMDILNQRTDDINRNNPRSLQNTPIPTPNNMMDRFGILASTDKFIEKDKFIENYKKGGRKIKTSVPKRYVPKQLSKKDRKKQAKELKRSRKNYKKGKYYTRKKMKSFKTKVSPHILKARKMYKIDKIRPTRKLAKASKCKLKGLKRMFKKGQGAYFSSGSRPNQTGHSWGYARMASAITGGKASAVDFKIIQENCSKNSRAYKLAKKALKKYKRGRRRVKQVQIGGQRMKESIVNFKKGPFPKKYTAIVKNKKNKKTRKIHFGDRRYQQYKDRTPLKLYAKNNHNTRKRMQNYFNRHSGTKKRSKAIKKEKRKSIGKYNAKILSHIYLW